MPKVTMKSYFCSPYLKKITILTSILFSLLLLFIYYLYLHNFSTVIPNQIYRSRQLSFSQFETAIQHYQLKTIINLRGAHPEKNWYQQELRAAAENHVKHFDFALSSKQLPDSDILYKLALTIESSPKPLLIHCESGVDRTGLAAAISLILANKSIDVAANEVSLKHFVLSDKSAGVQLIHLYKHWLEENKLTSNSKNYYQWVLQLNSEF